MLITFDESTVADVELLSGVDATLAGRLFDAAMVFLRNERGAGVAAAEKGDAAYAKMGKQLGIDGEVVHRIVDGVSKMLIEASKAKLSKDHFALAALDVSLPEDRMGALISFYAKNKEEVGEIVKRNAASARAPGSTPHYVDFDWRLDIEVARRTLRTTIEPNLLVRLDTATKGDKGSEVDSQFMNCDHATLEVLHRQLQSALAESKSVHTQRVFRYIR